jgi:hypothetical protein
VKISTVMCLDFCNFLAFITDCNVLKTTSGYILKHVGRKVYLHSLERGNLGLSCEVMRLMLSIRYN